MIGPVEKSVFPEFYDLCRRNPGATIETKWRKCLRCHKKIRTPAWHRTCAECARKLDRIRSRREESMGLWDVKA